MVDPKALEQQGAAPEQQGLAAGETPSAAFDASAPGAPAIEPGPGDSAQPSTRPYTVSSGSAPIPWSNPRYRLTRLLGKGGFGEVWQAHDSTLCRDVAVKMPRQDRVFDERSGQMFLDEARKIASLKHPHILPVFDAVADQSRCFFVCEYIEGTSLARKLQHERLSFLESAGLVTKIADALHYAHLHDIVHRDVKPGNILLDKSGKPYLTDFGLAASESDLVREAPTALGTLAYMSPEQARGASHLVDSRSDIYSLGVVLYQLLTGRLPYQADDKDRYREQIVERPARPLRTIDERIPAELEEICLRCLRKNPADRYPTAADLSRALKAWQEPRPVRSNRRLLAVAGVFFALALAVLATVLLAPLWQRADPDAARVPPEIPGHFDEEAAAIKPNVWYSMLRWKPKPLSFPGPPSKLDWQAGEPLWIHCADVGLISLGKAKKPGYRIRAKFRQENWQGLFGVFVGQQHGRDAMEVPICSYQLFKLHRTFLNRPALVVIHSNATEYNFARMGKPLENELQSSSVDLPPPKTCELTFTVDSKGAHSFLWDGVPMKGLGGDHANQYLDQKYAAPYQGEFGVQARQGATCLVDFEVLFLDSYFFP